jgi:hypothetical protein
MLLSHPLVGRLWCSFCPFMVWGEISQRLARRLGWHPAPWPHGDSDRWGAPLLAAGFAAILLWEELANLADSFRLSSCLLLLIIAGAVIGSLRFEKRFWCRYLCPVGGMNGLSASLGAAAPAPPRGLTLHHWPRLLGPLRPLQSSGFPETLHSRPLLPRLALQSLAGGGAFRARRLLYALLPLLWALMLAHTLPLGMGEGGRGCWRWGWRPSGPRGWRCRPGAPTPTWWPSARAWSRPWACWAVRCCCAGFAAGSGALAAAEPPGRRPRRGRSRPGGRLISAVIAEAPQVAGAVEVDRRLIRRGLETLVLGEVLGLAEAIAQPDPLNPPAVAPVPAALHLRCGRDDQRQGQDDAGEQLEGSKPPSAMIDPRRCPAIPMTIALLIALAGSLMLMAWIVRRLERA